MKQIRPIIVMIVFAFIFSSCNKNDDPGYQEEDNTPTDSTTLEEPGTKLLGAYFTDPGLIKSGIESRNILDRILLYINNTPKGEKIYTNVYYISNKAVIDALVLAYVRGVEVHISVDGETAASVDTFKKLGNFVEPSEVYPIYNGFKSYTINHEKYIIFSKVALSEGIAKNVVLSTSHNFGKASGKLAQDAIVISNKELYNIYKEHWKYLVEVSESSNMLDYVYSEKVVGDSIDVHFFPFRLDKLWGGKNIIAEDYLANLTNPSDKDTVKIAMKGDWKDSRGTEILNELISLNESGVNIQIIVGGNVRAYENTIALLEKLNKNDNGYVKITEENRIHSKYLLIKGHWSGKSNQEIIIAGSLNYHSTAQVYNNNQVLALKNSKLFNDYWDNWNRLNREL